MKTWLKWALVWTWSAIVLAWAWAWATKLWYIPNWLELEVLCSWNTNEIVFTWDVEEVILSTWDVGEVILSTWDVGEVILSTWDINSNRWENGWNELDSVNIPVVKAVAIESEKDYKPIIYLYPEKETLINVQLGYPENLTHTYPKYKEWWWNVVANPDWSLVDVKSNRNLYALYWEGYTKKEKNVEDWFVVKWEDTIPFLEEKLALLWLNEREAEEFIVYWLPKLEVNAYNLIRFRSQEEIEKGMPLKVNPQPDSVIRVLMEYKPLEEKIELAEQKLVKNERKGYSVIERWWTEIL